ncbi:hypothetical protein ADIWIN_0746 [Winogradskyella psychrotolerans RS-3]|uniref:Uncharacterized protein n=1 Tax=Winogradskyella psychrotolerans RS-3 TaxID=641526 RepID=S7X568_9FLAO|nr:DUF6090 family protein [Winogradskyella psychrotolerans]EPR74169.1 hypothetical protein ADIWIN_0746 [Winogradskyella psychrotolerans RS-3]
METNKTNKYFKYAIGEIILVVIGILIALQINNWNEQRKTIAEMYGIYQSIVDELETDIQTLDKILPDFAWKNNTIKRIINSNPSQDKWILNDSLFYSFVSTYDFEIGLNRFQQLKSKLGYNNETKELTNTIIDFYNKQQIDLNVKLEEHTISFNRNVSYWEENTEWFGDAYSNGDLTKLSAYVQDNPIFRNKIIWYGIVLRRLESALENTRRRPRL